MKTHTPITWGEFKELLQFVDVDSIQDDDIVFYRPLNEPHILLSGWAQEMILKARKDRDEKDNAEAP